MASSSKSFLSTLTSSVVGEKSPNVPSPMTLYNESAPRVIRALKQYDAAAPGIDFATKYWWLLAIGGFVVGVAAGYTAQVIYNKVHRRGT